MSGPGVVLAQRYRLDERIGGGAMGEVWRGTDTALDRTVAVKIVRQELLDQPEFRERFLVEARTMARIKHRGVVSVHDYQSDSELAFLVMEHIEGESLSQRLHRRGPIDSALAMALVAQAADALQAAHDTGVVHRDVKPGNLLVTAEDQVVLTDFGIARTVASAPLTATGALIGTMSYLSPEQVLGKPATARSDVYALGVVAYECLTGRRPFEGDNPFEIAMKRIQEAPPPLPGEIRPPVRAVVERALAAEPEQRWASAAELARAARQAASSSSAGRAQVPGPRSAPVGSASPPPVSPPPPTSPPPPVSSPPPPPASPSSSPPVTPSSPGAPAQSPPGYSPAPGYSHSPPEPATGAPPASTGYPPYQPSGYSPAGHSPAGYSSPGYPPPAYPGYQPASGRPPAAKQNTLGLVGMILGIVGIVSSICCGLFAIPLDVAAIVLGAMGLRKVSDGLADNRGMALAGIICGAVGVVLAVLMVLLNLAADFATLA